MDETEKAERRRAWKRNLLAIGLQSPDGNGSISSGVFHAWLELTHDMLKHGAADEYFLVDSIYLVARELEVE